MLVRRETAVAAAPGEVWRVVSDPESLPRWWPGVKRVEEATPEAWTTVLSSPRGKTVRADYTRIEAVEEERVAWRQELAESPFERILAAAVTSIALSAAGGDATRVEVALEQQPRGWARFAPLQFRAAGRRQVEGAIDGLQALFGEPDRP
jgi:uncharacterized protein YndB with AHSA1/START domain